MIDFNECVEKMERPENVTDEVWTLFKRQYIDMADRLTRYEAALRPFAEIAEGEVWDRFIADSKMNLRISNGDGSRHYAFINAECFEQARQALGDTQ